MCLAALLRRATLALVVTGLASQIALAASTESVRADGVTVRQGAEWVSPPSVPVSRRVDIRDLPAVPDWKPGDPIIEVPRQFYGDPNAPTPVPVNPVDGEDPLAARQRAWSAAREGRGGGGFTTPTVNAEGIRTTASPNDPTGDVGTLQFVMAINASGGSAVGVFNKTTGAQIGPTFTMASLVTGGTCATSGAGDPIVLFDAFANRWVLTEFTGTGNLLCVYLSSSDDLSQPQTWTRYAFNFPAFPDYPKYGVWPQAYFVGANENGTGGRRPFYAMDRARMLAGQPATVQRLTIPNLAGFGFQMTQPAHVSGTTLPPAGTPGLFMRHRDDEAHNASSNNPNADFLELFEFNVDWTTPANSNIVGPITFQIAEFSSNLNGLTAFNAFPQPNGQRLDPLRETVMHRLVYRRFATHESLVGNFVTDLYLGPSSIYPDDTGAVRWFELRRGPEPLPPDVLLRDGFEDPAFGVTWRLHQEGTFAPEDTPGVPANQADRWMGGINIDESGNLALAYNIVRQSPAIPAGLRYTGRLEADPLGVMTEPETVIVNGNGVTGTGSAAERWGDYADMGVDPVDGCTFWFVGNYANQTLNPSNSRANRFVAVRHDACGEPSLTLRATPESVAVCANSTSTVNAPPIQLQVTHTGGLTDPAALSFAPLPTGVSASANPTTINAPGGTSQITLGANNTAPAGPNAVTVQAVAGTVNRTLGLTLNVVNAAPGRSFADGARERRDRRFDAADLHLVRRRGGGELYDRSLDRERLRLDDLLADGHRHQLHAGFRPAGEHRDLLAGAGQQCLRERELQRRSVVHDRRRVLPVPESRDSGQQPHRRNRRSRDLGRQRQRHQSRRARRHHAHVRRRPAFAADPALGQYPDQSRDQSDQQPERRMQRRRHGGDLRRFGDGAGADRLRRERAADFRRIPHSAAGAVHIQRPAAQRHLAADRDRQRWSGYWHADLVVHPALTRPRSRGPTTGA